MGIRLNKHKPSIYFKVFSHSTQAQPGNCLALHWHGQLLLLPLHQQLSLPLLFQPKKGGGISFNSTVTLTQCSEKLVQLILHEYSILPGRASLPGGSWQGSGPHHTLGDWLPGS